MPGDSIDDILAAMGGGSSKPRSDGVHSAAASNFDGPFDDCNGSVEGSSTVTPRPPTALPPLDAAHRVAGPTGVDLRFRSASLRMKTNQAAELRDDCAVIFDQQTGSNWLPATATPRCSLEKLAKAIFDKHTASATFDPKRSGAEWWAQVRDGGQQQEGIEFHWDVDEHFCDLPDGGGVHVHPTLSTVTYLSGVGAPTLVLHTRGTPASAAAAEVAKAVHGAVPSGAISYPRQAKHIVFDGALLHGAVPCRGGEAPAGQRRVTFLVNVWLNHRPHAVERLPAPLAARLSATWRPHESGGAFRCDLATPPERRVEAEAGPSGGDGSAGGISGGGHGGHGGKPSSRLHRLHVSFGRNAKAHALHVLLPPRPPAVAAAAATTADSATVDAARQGSDSFRLVFAPGAATLSANTGGAGKLRPTVSRSGGATGGGSRAAGAATSVAGLPGEIDVKKRRKKKQRLKEPELAIGGLAATKRPRSDGGVEVEGHARVLKQKTKSAR